MVENNVESIDVLDNTETKDFVSRNTLQNNPHGVTVEHPEQLVLEGTTERLDKDSIQVSVVSESDVYFRLFV